VAFSLALATVLFLRHDYLIGALIAVLVVIRVAILIGTTRRRRPYMRMTDLRMTGSVAQPGASTPQPGVSSAASDAPTGRPLSGLARSEFLVAAGVIGMAPRQMRDAYDRGSSLAEMAATNGVPLERVVNAIVGDASLKVDDAVSQGTMNPRFAARFKSRLPVWADRIVNHHKRDLQRAQ
jgi:hypothetical protein